MFDGATGVGQLDRTIIDTLHRLGANPDGRPIRAAGLLTDLDGQGIPPRYAYEHLCLSTQRSLCWVRPYRPTGNAGSRTDPPAGPRYVDMSLSEVGELLATETQVAALPVGFVNGNMHVDGLRPAFEPARVLDAVALAATKPQVSDTELVDAVGPPSFPVGCTVEGDVDGLHAGEEVTLTLAARLDPDPTGNALLMTGVPPVVNPLEVLASLADRATPHPRHPGAPALDQTLLPLGDVNDGSMHDEELYVLTPRRGTTIEELGSKVIQVWGVTTPVRAQLPAPTAAIIRHHAQGEPSDVARATRRLRELTAPDY
jgi:hypothetical protein